MDDRSHPSSGWKVTFRSILTACALAFATPIAHATAEPPPTLIVLGSLHAVTFPGTASPDGRYILAWTLLPAKKNQPPFDWSDWTPAAPTAIFEKLGPENGGGRNAPYNVQDIFVDLARKRWALLPSSLPTWYHKGFGPITVCWEPARENGLRHALIQNPAHFGSMDLWLVTAGKTISVRDEFRAANDAVAARARQKNIDARALQTWFAVDSDGNASGTFGEDAIEIPFDAGTTRDSLLKGTLTLRLIDGKIVAAKRGSEPNQFNPPLCGPAKNALY